MSGRPTTFEPRSALEAPFSRAAWALARWALIVALFPVVVAALRELPFSPLAHQAFVFAWVLAFVLGSIVTAIAVGEGVSAVLTTLSTSLETGEPDDASQQPPDPEEVR